MRWTLVTLVVVVSQVSAAAATLRCTGTLEPRDVFDVGAMVPGRIAALGADPRAATDPAYAGKTVDSNTPVEEGTLLAKLDDATYRAERDVAKADLAAAEAKLAAARASKAPAPDVEAAQAILEAARAKLKLAELRLERTTIRSPVAGTVLARRVNVGQSVTGPDLQSPSLFLIADLSRLAVWASVNEVDIARVRAGQRARFTCDAFPGTVFRGTVEKVRRDAIMTGNVVTYTVDLSIDYDANRDDAARLLPYMTANVAIDLDAPATTTATTTTTRSP